MPDSTEPDPRPIEDRLDEALALIAAQTEALTALAAKVAAQHDELVALTARVNLLKPPLGGIL